jgi:hypothetical protein
LDESQGSSITESLLPQEKQKPKRTFFRQFDNDIFAAEKNIEAFDISEKLGVPVGEEGRQHIGTQIQGTAQMDLGEMWEDEDGDFLDDTQASSSVQSKILPTQEQRDVSFSPVPYLQLSVLLIK